MTVYFCHKQEFYFYAGAWVSLGTVFVQKYSFAFLKYLSPGFNSCIVVFALCMTHCVSCLTLFKDWHSDSRCIASLSSMCHHSIGLPASREVQPNLRQVRAFSLLYPSRPSNKKKSLLLSLTFELFSLKRSYTLFLTLRLQSKWTFPLYPLCLFLPHCNICCKFMNWAGVQKS